jgi:hypothetical protein
MLCIVAIVNSAQEHEDDDAETNARPTACGLWTVDRGLWTCFASYLRQVRVFDSARSRNRTSL